MIGTRPITLIVMLLAHTTAAQIVKQQKLASFHMAVRQNAGREERKLERGGRVHIRNPFGSIIITGWERDTVHATTDDGVSPRIVFEQAPNATLTVSLAETTRDGGRVNLNVSLSRSAEIQVESEDGNVQIGGTTSRVVVRTGGGNVQATHIGSLVVNSQRGSVRVSGTTGAVTIETGGSVSVEDVGGNLVAKSSSNGSASVTNARGLVDLSVVNGGVRVRSADGDVRIASINGGVGIACVKGRVEVSNVNGSIALSDIGGDVDATTSNSPIEFRGAINAGRRYRLKSHAASVSMALSPDTPGFTATLSSYRGGMETDFPLATESPFSNRRLIGRYKDGGDGRTLVQLDSFNGTIKLIKGTAVATTDCRR